MEDPLDTWIESQRILSILEESDSEEGLSDNDDVDEENHVSVCTQPSDTEQLEKNVNLKLTRTKCGVDVVDELSATYDVSRNSNRWPLTIFYAMLNISAINGLIIHRMNNNKPKEKRRHFLKSLGLALFSNHLKNRQNLNRLPREMRKRIRELTGDSTEEPTAKIPNARKRCQICPTKKDRARNETCRGCDKYICPEHIIPFCSDCVNNEDTNQFC
ncbi:unnamed protein product, partial [Brenthis ino]